MRFFLSGVITFGFAIAGLFFLKFWKKTRDRLFINFSVAFWLLAINQLSLSIIDQTNEARTFVYILRVIAFCFILFAIVDKNILPFRKKEKS